MPVPSGSYGQSMGNQPSCFQRMKMGFMMGFCVGMATGAIFGGFSCLRLVCFLINLSKLLYKTVKIVDLF